MSGARRRQQRNAFRAGGGATAREIDIPLPVQGAFTEAKSSEVSGMYAGELLNWRSTGAALRIRPTFTQEKGGRKSLQRAPFEFGASQSFIEIGAHRINLGDNFLLRTYVGPHSVGYISGSAIMVDGAGDPVIANRYDVATTVFTTSTDITADQFDGFVAHQDRPFFWKKRDELDFYYGDVGAVTGALTRFPLGRLGNITGSILCCRSLTIDSGEGMNDVFAIFTTTGQIVCYRGLNPGDDWQQIGRIKVAPPVSDEAFVAVGADLWMLTASGVVSVLDTMRQSSLALVSTISRPVQEDLVAQIAEGGDWSMHLSADGLRVIINRVFNGVASQIIYWTDTKAWTTADYPARAWHNSGLKTCFTTLDGELATIADADQLITARWVSSWFRLGKAGGIAYLRPTIIARGPLDVTVTLLSDHDDTPSDIAEATQTVHVEPDNPPGPGGRVALNETIGSDAVGEVFQLTLEVTAQWAELVSLRAGVQ